MERKVAQFLLEVGSRAAAMSAAEIAEVVGTSDATVVRTARTLGFEGMRGLRRALTELESGSDVAARFEATIGDLPTDHVLAVTADRHIRAMDAMIRQVSEEKFDAAVRLLSRATRTWWCGTGPSAYLAGYGSFLTRRLGRPSDVFTHAGTDHADELLALAPGDAVVVLAYGRVHAYVRVLLRRAREVGAKTILVTDTLASRLADEADLQVNAGRGVPGLFASHATTVVLIEAMVLAIAATDPEHAQRTLAELNSLRRQLAGRQVPVDPA
jgi:DNA-binding MurR/RpiR family transcriptional regulator